MAKSDISTAPVPEELNTIHRNLFMLRSEKLLARTQEDKIIKISEDFAVALKEALKRISQSHPDLRVYWLERMEARRADFLDDTQRMFGVQPRIETVAVMMHSIAPQILYSGAELHAHPGSSREADSEPAWGRLGEKKASRDPVSAYYISQYRQEKGEKEGTKRKTTNRGNR